MCFTKGFGMPTKLILNCELNGFKSMKKKQLVNILTELRNLPAENEVLEFKEAKNDYDFNKLGKYFSALSNEANLKGRSDAWLIFGIEDKKKAIVSTNYRSNSPAALDSLKGEIASKTTNRITFLDIYEVMRPEGRVLMFHIPSAPPGIPIAWDGHYYGRDGGELSPLNLEEIERIRKQGSNLDWSAGICKRATIRDLDPSAISLARKNFKVKNPRLADRVDEWDTPTFLNKAKLTINNQITRTAVLLLGRTESEHFISPAVARISWVLRDKDNIEKDYQHFTCPFILSINGVFSKIRNLKYRYLKEGTLFPDEVDQYDPFNLREALTNCIVHQDYNLSGKINVVEREDGYLTFSNLGEFLPGSIESVIESDAPPAYYRNAFLAQAMVNLNMIDTVGSGIKRMFRLQSQRFFPMPDYDISEGQVKATLTGKVLDMDFARTLAKNPALTLSEIIMLDKVQKRKPLGDDEITHLRQKKLIEGRKPNYIIAQTVAVKTNQLSSYLKNRGFDKEYYKKLLIELFRLNEAGTSKKDIKELLWAKLPDVLSDRQKMNKISTILTELKRSNLIENTGSDTRPCWRLKNYWGG